MSRSIILSYPKYIHFDRIIPKEKKLQTHENYQKTSDLEEYVQTLEKKYQSLHNGTSDLLRVLNACQEIIKENEPLADKLESAQKAKLKPIPPYPTSFQQAQDEHLPQMFALCATPLRRQSEQYIPECFRPKRYREKRRMSRI